MEHRKNKGIRWERATQSKIFMRFNLLLKFLWNKPFHRIFIEFVGTKSFVWGYKFPYRILILRISHFFRCSKGGLKLCMGDVTTILSSNRLPKNHLKYLLSCGPPVNGTPFLFTPVPPPLFPCSLLYRTTPINRAPPLPVVHLHSIWRRPLIGRDFLTPSQDWTSWPLSFSSSGFIDHRRHKVEEASSIELHFSSVGPHGRQWRVPVGHIWRQPSILMLS